MTWASVGGKRYRVERSPDLLRSAGAFTAVVEVVEDDVPSGVETTESVAPASGGVPAFYRVRLVT